MRGMGRKSHHAEDTEHDAAHASLGYREVLARIAPYLWGLRLRIAGALLLMAGAKAATVSLPVALGKLIDTLGERPAQLPVVLLLAYGGLRLGSSLLRELQTLVFARTRLTFERRIALDVVGHLYALDLGFHLNRQTGAVLRDMQRGASSVGAVASYGLFSILPAFVELAMVAGLLQLRYGAVFVAITVATFAAYIAFTLLTTRWRLRFRSQMNQQDSAAQAQATDGLLNYEAVKSYANEGFELHRYDQSLGKLEMLSVQSQRSLSVLNGGQALLIALGVTAMMWAASSKVQNGTMSLGDLAAVNGFLLQLFLPLGFLGTLYNVIRQSMVDMARMGGLLAQEPKIQDPKHPKSLPHLAVTTTAAITAAITPTTATDSSSHAPYGLSVAFDKVGFAYSQDGREILRHVSWQAKPGQTIAWVGPSGAGKSTLMRLLMRHFEATSGSVRIGDIDVRDLRQKDFRSVLAVVPQDVALFNDTLAYNIRYGNLDASEDEISQAAQDASLGDLLARLPKGLQTRVGERGLKLSGGEKQRVAIARALLRKPRLLIFDEATASLDSVSEQAIVAAIKRIGQQCTTVVIAHRLSTVVHADKIFVLDDGQIAQSGTHSELSQMPGIYARMWQLQQDERHGSLADDASLLPHALPPILPTDGALK